MDEYSPPKAAAINFHEERAEAFSQRYRQFESDAFRSTFTYGRRKINQLIDDKIAGLPIGAALLDVGCGTGFDLKRFAARGHRVTGIEPSTAMREFAIAENPHTEIIAGDIENIPLPDASFDLVLSIEVLRYLKNSRRAFQELRRVARPGATVIVTVAPLLSLNGYPLVHALTSRIGVHGFAKVRQSFTTAAATAREARAAGFSTVEVVGVFFGPWHLLGRLSPSALASALRRFEPLDDWLGRRPALRDTANHLVVIAHR